jgi:hypothetical protein
MPIGILQRDYRSPRFSRRSRALLSAFRRGLRRMLAPDLVRALLNRCLRDMRMVIAHLLGVTPVPAARRGPNGCRARIARCETHDISLTRTRQNASASARRAASRSPSR